MSKGSYAMTALPPSGSENRAFDGDLKDLSISNVGLKSDEDDEKKEKSSDGKLPEIMQDEFEELEPPERPNFLASFTAFIRNNLINFYRKHRRPIHIFVILVLVCFYFAYFSYAMYYERLKNESSIRLLWVTCFVSLQVFLYLLRRWRGANARAFINKRICQPLSDWNEEYRGKPKIIFLGIFISLLIGGLIAVIVVMVALKNPENLISLAGIFCLMLMTYVCSVHPDRVNWRPVLVGMLLQFIFAILILKTKPGYAVFKFIGDRVAEFLAHTSAGSQFLFNQPDLKLFGFAFTVLPVILFFASVISVLFYIGLMQMIIQRVAWIMRITMGTTAAESLNAAGNIFVGMTESPLMIRPFVGRMTNSELHAVMTCGFATVAGSVLGAYILFGVPANHLISASVMSAPAALAVSKLIYPETKRSMTTARHVKEMDKSPYKNVVEAAAGGVIASVAQVAYIGAILIAFLAILDFVNQTLTWFGNRAGMAEPLTFEFICSYLLWPLSFVMGVEYRDCRKVSQLIGVKTFVNEFVAYGQLGEIIKNSVVYRNWTSSSNVTFLNRGNDLYIKEPNITLTNGILYSMRSEVIATYSLCGFSNFGSIGIMIGALTVMAPKRQGDIASLAFRAMMAGNVACFLTACIAGLFYAPP